MSNDDGDFPRLNYSMQSYVIRYDPEAKKALLGGLGALGVGRMWIDMSPEEFLKRAKEEGRPDAE